MGGAEPVAWSVGYVYTSVLPLGLHGDFYLSVGVCFRASVNYILPFP